MSSQEELVNAGVMNMARMWETPARITGGRTRRWESAWAADSKVALRMLNRTTVVQRLEPSAAGDLASRIVRFYAERPNGGDYLVEDPWATLDLEPFGFARLWSLEFMLRPASVAPRTPSTVVIQEARSRADLAEFVLGLVEGFEIAGARDLPATAILDERILRDGRLRCWFAVSEGRPVGTAAAYLSNGVVGVYWISVIPSMRRCGYGAALTSEAALAGHAPATLQATSLGRGLYERMGFTRVMTSATWIRKSRASDR